MPKHIRHIFKEGLSYDQARLGSLTVDLAHPWDEIFHPTSPWPSEYTTTTEDENFHKIFQRSKGTRFYLFLTKIFKINASFNESEDASIVTAKRIIQTLVNYEDAFMHLTEDNKSARDWVQKRFNRSKDVYIIVRTETFASAHVRFSVNDQSSFGGDLSIPLTNIVQPLPVVDGALDVGGGIQKQKSQPESAKFTAVGDRIYVVEYRKVSREWLPQPTFTLPPITKTVFPIMRYSYHESTSSGPLISKPAFPVIEYSNRVEVVHASHDAVVASFEEDGMNSGDEANDNDEMEDEANDDDEMDDGANDDDDMEDEQLESDQNSDDEVEDEKLETYVDHDSAEEVEYVFSLEDE